MNWFIYAIAAPFLWAIDNHIDKLVLNRYYKDVRPGTVMFLSALTNGLFSLLIFCFYRGSLHLPLSSELLILFAGCLYFVAAFPYFYALKQDEASRIAPLFQAQPIFAYILGASFLGELLSPKEMIAGLIIIIGSILISIDLDNGFKLKQKVFWLMMLSTLLVAIGAFLFKFVGETAGFWPTAFYQYLGTAAAGVALFILSPSRRNDLLSVMNTFGKPVFAIGLLTESINTAARVAFNFATLLAPLAVVTFVAGLQPIFVFAIGIVVTILMPRLGKENLVRKHLLQKCISISMILVGTSLLI
jgi:uncharacterized membrane protein